MPAFNPEGLPDFKMDTETIPDGVDRELAEQRTALIEGWRSGEVAADVTMRRLMALYWDTQQTTDGQTNAYLIRSAYEFPVESGLSMDEADAIYQASLPAN